MTDQDQDKDPDPTKLGIRPTDADPDGDPDVEGHAAGRPVRTTADEDDVEGHFSRSAPRSGLVSAGWFAVAARIVLTSNGVACG